MDQFNSQDFQRNLADRQQTRIALAQKLETLEARMRDNIEQVKESVRRSTDLRYQVDQRPWAMIGASVVLGLIAGRIVAPRRHSFQIPTKSEVDNLVRRGSDSTRKGLEALTESLNLDRYASQFGGLKKAALAVLIPIAGELARNVMPAILAQIDKYSKTKEINEPEEKLQETGERVNDRVRSAVH